MMAKDTLALIQEIALEYLSPFLFAISSESLLWYLTHSSATANEPAALTHHCVIHVKLNSARADHGRVRYFLVVPAVS